jgi:hypothetical protein
VGEYLECGLALAHQRGLSLGIRKNIDLFAETSECMIMVSPNNYCY